MEPVDWLPDWVAYPLFLIWLNQTLIAGVAASVAAYFTVKHLQQQNDQTEKHRQEEFQRRLKMHRAGLPAALAELTDYAEACVHQRWCLLHSVPLSGFRSDLQSIDLPNSAVQAIQAATEALDDEMADEFERLLSFYQIHFSRLGNRTLSVTAGGSVEHVLDPEKLKSQILDSLLLRSAVARLFSFSRRRNDGADDWHTAENAFNAIATIVLPNGGSKPLDCELEEYIQRRWDRAVQRFSE